MSHRSRKKRHNDSKGGADGKQKFTHSKREYITSEDGWTHVTDRKWKSMWTKHQSHLVLENPLADMTLEEMAGEHSRYKQQWENSDACVKLKEILSNTEINERYAVKNVICLGLGSLQALPMGWRMSSHTQLAALKTITETLNINCQVIMQDPRFTDLDKLLLESMDCEVVDHPEAFQHLSTNSMVYAIHCPFRLLWKVKEKAYPALLISNDLRESRVEEIRHGGDGVPDTPEHDSQQNEEEGEKIHSKQYDETLSLIRDCEEMQFPQLRNDFSSTMIYWRRLKPGAKLQDAAAIESS